MILNCAHQFVTPLIFTILVSMIKEFSIKFTRLTLVFLLMISIASCCAKKKNKTENSSSLLRVCPEEWIQNKMPGIEGQEAKEYFIIEGKRREIKEFDLEWIKKNCSVKPQVVQ